MESQSSADKLQSRVQQTRTVFERRGAAARSIRSSVAFADDGDPETGPMKLHTWGSRRPSLEESGARRTVTAPVTVDKSGTSVVQDEAHPSRLQSPNSDLPPSDRQPSEQLLSGKVNSGQQNNKSRASDRSPSDDNAVDVKEVEDRILARVAAIPRSRTRLAPRAEDEVRRPKGIMRLFHRHFDPSTVSPPPRHIICVLCGELVAFPVLLPCSHLTCLECIGARGIIECCPACQTVFRAPKSLAALALPDSLALRIERDRVDFLASRAKMLRHTRPASPARNTEAHGWSRLNPVRLFRRHRLSRNTRTVTVAPEPPNP